MMWQLLFQSLMQNGFQKESNAWQYTRIPQHAIQRNKKEIKERGHIGSGKPMSRKSVLTVNKVES